MEFLEQIRRTIGIWNSCFEEIVHAARTVGYDQLNLNFADRCVYENRQVTSGHESSLRHRSGLIPPLMLQLIAAANLQ